MRRSCRRSTHGTHRRRRPISVSLFDSIADWMAVPLIHREYTGREPKRLGLNHATIAPYGAYAAGDGAQFIISIQTEAEWASLCRGARPARHDRLSALLDQQPPDRQSGGARRGDGEALSRFDAPRWRRRYGAPTSPSAATIRSANWLIIPVASRGGRTPAARSASLRRPRFSTSTGRARAVAGDRRTQREIRREFAERGLRPMGEDCAYGSGAARRSGILREPGRYGGLPRCSITRPAVGSRRGSAARPLALFPHRARESGLGPDGHPARGGFLPPSPCRDACGPEGAIDFSLRFRSARR